MIDVAKRRVRIARLLRVFRILKLASFLHEADVLRRALPAGRAKVTVFLGAVLAIVVVTGTLMYLIEYENPGFDNMLDLSIRHSRGTVGPCGRSWYFSWSPAANPA